MGFVSFPTLFDFKYSFLECASFSDYTFKNKQHTVLIDLRNLFGFSLISFYLSVYSFFTLRYFRGQIDFLDMRRVLLYASISKNRYEPKISLERRWSSRTFRYGYLVTTSPQSSTPPSTAASLRLAHRLRVLSTLMVWRAVCTRPGNVFTATFWFAITSNSTFMQASCSLQSELRPSFVIRSTSRLCCTLLSAIVVRV